MCLETEPICPTSQARADNWACWPELGGVSSNVWPEFGLKVQSQGLLVT